MNRREIPVDLEWLKSLERYLQPDERLIEQTTTGVVLWTVDTDGSSRKLVFVAKR